MIEEWIEKNVDPKAVKKLSHELILSPIEARLLLTRGINTSEEAVKFLSPSIDYLHDPFLFNEMEKATEILHRGITERSRILIHGDYDADGICGASVLYEALSRMGADVYYFIPDRYRDGYGLSRRVMERGLEVGLDIVVSVDCGSSDLDVISFLASNGVKTIITDHHEVRERPAADAFINPKLPGERYPFKELTGAGVAFKLLQGLEKRMAVNLSLERYLDLVAVGTLGDYASVVDENRILISKGMDVLGSWRRPGLKALRENSGLKAEGFSPRRICFTIIPRLNSPGRMGSAKDVVRLLITDDPAEARRIAAGIEDKNIHRKAQDSRVTEEACYLADIILKRSEPNALVFSSGSWSEGVVGISAARLAEKYNLPSVLIAVRDGIGKGSVRSASKVNVKETLERCSEFLLEFGGHKEAGGFSIKESDIPRFQRLFDEIVGEISQGEMKDDRIYVDAEINIEESNLKLVSFLEKLMPFGPGNHEPTFLMKALTVEPDSRIVGNGHLSLVVSDRSGASSRMIGFSFASSWDINSIIGSSVDTLVHLRKNQYMGKTELQLQIVDMRMTGK